jgi:hypothetical protein
MPEITLPEVKLPDIKLPDGFREMTRDDIVQAARDVRLPKIQLPEVDLPKVELPDQIADRLPRRRRANPLIPLLALTIVGLAVAAVWWLVASPTTGPRVRRAVEDLRSRMNGEPSDLVRYDDETHLDSLLGQSDSGSTPTPADPYGIGEMGALNDETGVAVGPGTTANEEMRATIR